MRALGWEAGGMGSDGYRKVLDIYQERVVGHYSRERMAPLEVGEVKKYGRLFELR